MYKYTTNKMGSAILPVERVYLVYTGCYAIFLSTLLTNNGTSPAKIEAHSSIKLGERPTLTAVKLKVSGEVPDVDRE